MDGTYKQEMRVASFTTPLGKDALALKSFHGREAISDLFEFRIDAIARDHSPDFDRAIGKNCTLSLWTPNNDKRHFDGILTEVHYVEEMDEGHVYRLVLRPWLWLLSKRRNCTIFRDLRAPEIVGQIFNKSGGSFEDKLTRDYPKLEYAVQYRESDMDFVRRLMEEHGISFHFRHEEGKHTLVMGDGQAAYPAAPGKPREFCGLSGTGTPLSGEHLLEWAPHRRFTSNAVALNDYDFEKPTARMLREERGDKAPVGTYEIYDYPGKYTYDGKGEQYARRRLEEEQATDGRFLAKGISPSLSPGMVMQMARHPERAYNTRKHLVLACTHTFESQVYRSTGTPEGLPTPYEGTYELMDSARPYAPPCVTPKPYIRGPQTAVVVGSGDIDCDKYGRIKVQFHWDRESTGPMHARVSQVWASDKWGGIFIPRVGMEVVVDFLEGDPDRPIVVGTVYNAKNMPPFDLPGKKNLSGWKSNTIGGGGYNEIAFDDTAGKELVRVHAQYDMDTTVQHDEARSVGHKRSTSIGVDDTLTVGDKLLIEAGSKITLKVGTSTIVMDSTSITLDATTIKVQAKANLQTKSSALASHKADGAMTIKGMIVNIN